MDINEHSSPREIEVKDASQFLKALREGKSPDQAALDVGKPLLKLMRDPNVIGRLEKLKDYYFAKAQDRKALVIARMTEVLLNGEDRDSTAAARVLAQDPDLELQGNTGVTVTVNLSEDVAQLQPGDPWSKEKEK